MTWGYVTGFFDGEGNVWIDGKRCWLSFANTDLAALEAIQAFMGCGLVRRYSAKRPGWKVGYTLTVQRRADLVRVIPLLLEHSLIKRERLEALLVRTSKTRDESAARGALGKLGVAEVTRLYWNEGLNTTEIAAQVGCCRQTVGAFMRTHDIPRRPRAERTRLARAA